MGPMSARVVDGIGPSLVTEVEGRRGARSITRGRRTALMTKSVIGMVRSDVLA